MRAVRLTLMGVVSTGVGDHLGIADRPERAPASLLSDMY